MHPNPDGTGRRQVGARRENLPAIDDGTERRQVGARRENLLVIDDGTEPSYRIPPPYGPLTERWMGRRSPIELEGERYQPRYEAQESFQRPQLFDERSRMFFKDSQRLSENFQRSFGDLQRSFEDLQRSFESFQRSPENSQRSLENPQRSLENFQRSSENFQYGPEPPPTQSDSLTSVGPELKSFVERQSVRDSAQFSTSHGLSRLIQVDDARVPGGETNSEPDAIGNESGSEAEFARAHSIIELARKRGRPASPKLPPYHSPERQGDKIYQCRRCYCGFRQAQRWSYHEIKCLPRIICVCMKDEPSRIDDRGNSRCPFCAGPDSSDQHLNDYHRCRACLERPEVDRLFITRHALNSHLKKFHLATEKMPASWCLRKYRSIRSYWCGFCNAYRADRRQEMQHVANHFRDTEQVFDMTRWKSEPETECAEPQRPEPQSPEPQRPEPESTTSREPGGLDDSDLIA